MAKSVNMHTGTPLESSEQSGQRSWFCLGICTGKPWGTRGRTRTRTWQKPIPAQKGMGFSMGIQKPAPVPTPVKGLPVGNTYKLVYGTALR